MDSVRFSRKARKHKVSRDTVRHVIANAVAVAIIPPPDDRPDERILFIGDGQDGLAYEVMAVRLDAETLSVIHAMPMRRKYQEMYDQGKER